MAKTQIIFIHGGTVFETRDKYYRYLQNKEYNPFEVKKRWPEYLIEHLGEKVIFFSPQMPAKQDADYIAWKIWFEKLFPFLQPENVILIGSSLGTIFLSKYLSENIFPRTIQSLHLVWSVFDGEGIEVEDIGNFALQAEKIQNIDKQVKDIHLYHSRDDDVCPWHQVEKYMSYFWQAQLHEFADRGHFWQPEFPELLEQIQKEIS